MSEPFSEYKSAPSLLATRFISGAFWSVFGAVISRGLGLFSSIVVARLLGKSIFGELGIIQSTVGAFGIFSGLALGMTATRYVAIYRCQDRERVGRILALSSLLTLCAASLVSLAAIGFSPLIALKILNAEHLSTTLIFASGLIFFGALNGLQTGALAGFEEFRAIARVNLIAGLATFPLVVSGALLWKLNGVVLGLVGGLVINWWLNKQVLARICLEENISTDYSGCLSEQKMIWEFGLPAFLGSVVISPVTWYANVLLVNQEKGYEAMGIFNAAFQWQNMILFVPMAMTPFVLSRLSREHVSDRGSYWKTVNISFVLNGFLAFAAAAAVSALSYVIMNSYGKAFSDGWPVLVLLSATAVLISTILVIGQVIASSASMWTTLLLNSMWGAAFLLISTPLVVTHREVGLASAYLISYGCHLGWTFLVFLRIKRRLRQQADVSLGNEADIMRS
jgi:O-antigen/teichoic acid export membrane protein